MLFAFEINQKPLNTPLSLSLSLSPAGSVRGGSAHAGSYFPQASSPGCQLPLRGKVSYL